MWVKVSSSAQVFVDRGLKLNSIWVLIRGGLELGSGAYLWRS